jgi:hypothetical protein
MTVILHAYIVIVAVALVRGPHIIICGHCIFRAVLQGS